MYLRAGRELYTRGDVTFLLMKGLNAQGAKHFLRASP